MSAGHTLGRWHVQPSFLTIYGTSNGDGTGLTTAIASTLDGNGSLASDTMKANARLIAAAPDLLEALREWISSYDGWSDFELQRRVDPATLRRIKITRAAIARATGAA